MSFIFLWNPSVIPLFFVNRHIRAISSVQSSKVFESWLTETVTEPYKHTRIKRLLDWENAPSARLAHPREDHLLPLMVNVGAAGDDTGDRVFLDKVWGISMASYRFG